MTTAMWFLLIGALLLSVGLLTTFIKQIPVTSAMLYLVAGIIVGPTGLALFHFNPLTQSSFLEVLTECAVLISLFAAGVKMPVPATFKRWRCPIQLASISMMVSVSLVAFFAVYVLKLPWGAGILLGAIVAPTDPVLATDIQVRHPGDEDRLRFALTCEAGMNDGTAFPFVMLGLGLLGLHDLGEFGTRWLIVDVFWATAAGIAIGVFFGCLLGRLVWNLRRKHKSFILLDDFLGLGLIASVYGVSLALNAWGFLAVFIAAVALRQTEARLASSKKESLALQDSVLAKSDGTKPYQHLSEASLVFKEHLERISELVLIILLGGTLFVNSWSARAVGFAIFVFLVARPLSVYIGLIGASMPLTLRSVTGWFGVRGIGSLYYLMYAIQHGLPESIALELIHVVIITITLSILLHGVSVKPIVKFYEKAFPINIRYAF